jgi:hypothetical protein
MKKQTKKTYKISEAKQAKIKDAKEKMLAIARAVNDLDLDLNNLKESDIAKIPYIEELPMLNKISFWEKIACIKMSKKPCSAWSISNLSIMLNNNTEDARTYLQWKKAGRQVKKGSECFHIFGPKFAKKSTKETKEEEKKDPQLIGFKIIPVFRFEDTQGKEIEEVPQTIQIPQASQNSQAIQDLKNQNKMPQNAILITDLI